MRKIITIILFAFSLSLRGQVMIPGVIASSVQSVVSYSIDFQSYNTGAINGQDYWVNGYSGENAVVVVDVSGDKRVTGNITDDGMAYYNVSDIGNDHYVEIEIDATGSSGNYIGVAVRCSQQMNFYGLLVRNGVAYLSVYQNYTPTDIANSITPTINIGDVVGLGISGNTLTVYKNGSVWSEWGDAISPATGSNGVYTDTRLTTGKPGIVTYGNSGTASGDNFYVE